MVRGHFPISTINLEARMFDFADMLNVKEAAALLRVPTGTLRKWTHEKKVPKIKFSGKHVRYSKRELIAWAAAKSSAVEKPRMASVAEGLKEIERIAEEMEPLIEQEDIPSAKSNATLMKTVIDHLREIGARRATDNSGAAEFEI